MTELPPGFLDELRTRVTLSDVVGRKVTWDPRKSNSAKGEFWAPCPFHQEKTPSFKVDDRRGSYYCFGCQAKGDAISFLRETENMGFIEAVEVLAGQAGLDMPARDPRAKEKADRTQRLALVMEEAVAFFRAQWRSAAAAQARAYMEGKRGLDAATLDRFEIGFAPDSWDALITHLTGKGFGPDLIQTVGLAKTSDRTGNLFAMFRNRVMFPIRDARGRCIAFGARAVAPDDQPKYLNSPDTPLFDKSRTLYNLGPARAAAGRGQALIVAEGYMDVIALARAGFEAAVAPLGTAMTEAHLDMLWRVADEPVIALDGDRAGLAAAEKTVTLALPKLQAGKGLRFCILPDGQDPDDLIAAQGAGAMQALIAGSRPMADLLWRMRTKDRVFDSPERRAALDKALQADLRKIADPSLRSHYQDELRRLRADLFGLGAASRQAAQNRPYTRGKWQPPVAMPVNETLAGAAQLDALRLHEAVILATLITHPDLIPEVADRLESLTFATEFLGGLLPAVLAQPSGGDLRRMLEAAGHGVALTALFSMPHVRIAPPVTDPDNTDKARLTLEESLRKLQARQGHLAEIQEALSDFDPDRVDAITWRLAKSAAERLSADIASKDDGDEFESLPSGAVVRRSEREAFEALLAEIRSADP